MDAYLDIVKKIFEDGEKKSNRTGVDVISVPGVMFEHNMSKGFPLLTTKKVLLRLVSSELEFFIKGLTDKNWLRDRNNHIWDEWCSPDKVAYGHDKETKKKMLEERELGPIYGWQWRNFGAEYVAYNKKPKGKGIDQLANVVNKLKEDPSDRRMIVSAWNPVDFHRMALPPCHYSFQVIAGGKDFDTLNLIWDQRSVNTALGLPFNIAGYGLLLHLLAKEAGMKEGRLVGSLKDTHIYVNHFDGLKEQLGRTPGKLPTIETEKFTSIFDWKYEDSVIKNYNHQKRIKFQIAV